MKQSNGEQKPAAGTKFTGKPVRDWKAPALSRNHTKESMKKNEHKS